MNERLKGVHDLAVEISEDGKLSIKEAFKLLDLAFCAGELSMIAKNREQLDTI